MNEQPPVPAARERQRLEAVLERIVKLDASVGSFIASLKASVRDGTDGAAVAAEFERLVVQWEDLFKIRLPWSVFVGLRGATLPVIIQCVYIGLTSAFLFSVLNTAVQVMVRENPSTFTLAPDFAPLLLQQTCVAWAFAVVTTVAYLGFVESVTTSPAWRGGNSFEDVVQPLSQGILFGAAFCFPWLFPAAIFVHSSMAFGRHHRERQALAAAFDASIRLCVEESQATEDGELGSEPTAEADAGDLGAPEILRRFSIISWREEVGRVEAPSLRAYAVPSILMLLTTAGRVIRGTHYNTTPRMKN